MAPLKTFKTLKTIKTLPTSKSSKLAGLCQHPEKLTIGQTCVPSKKFKTGRPLSAPPKAHNWSIRASLGQTCVPSKKFKTGRPLSAPPKAYDWFIYIYNYILYVNQRLCPIFPSDIVGRLFNQPSMTNGRRLRHVLPISWLIAVGRLEPKVHQFCDPWLD